MCSISITLYVFVEVSGLGWLGNLELEKLLKSLTVRNHRLLGLLSLSRPESLAQVDLIDEMVTLVEVFDAHWVVELGLRHAFDESVFAYESAKERLHEQNELLQDLQKESLSMESSRRRYGTDLRVEVQSLLKNKSKLEDILHQHLAFKRGVALLDDVQSSQESIRCAYNDLRRVNALLEEKLVLTGVAKQRVMKELQSLFVQLRAECFRDSFVRFKQLMDDPLFTLDDPNLSPSALADIDQIWRAAVPVIPSLSGDAIHTDLITLLATSCGHFCEQAIRESPSDEASLVEVLGAETNRYSSIAGALRAVISDTRVSFDGRISVLEVVGDACTIIRKRLGCDLVVFWNMDVATSEGGVATRGAAVATSEGGRVFQFFLDEKQTPFFQRSLNETCFMGEITAQENTLPGDVEILFEKGWLCRDCKFSGFSVSSHSGGMTVFTTAKLPSFAAIYVDQFYKRILSAIAPLAIAQSKHSSNQRPLQLVDCMFELRKSGNDWLSFLSLVEKHLHVLFGATNVQIWTSNDEVSPSMRRIVQIGQPVIENGRIYRPFSRGRIVVWILSWEIQPGLAPDDTQILTLYCTLMEKLMAKWKPNEFIDEPLLSYDFMEHTQDAIVQKIVAR